MRRLTVSPRLCSQITSVKSTLPKARCVSSAALFKSSFASMIWPLRICRRSSAPRVTSTPSSSIGPNCSTIASLIFLTTSSKCAANASRLFDLLRNSMSTSSALRPAASNIFAGRLGIVVTCGAGIRSTSRSIRSTWT